MNSLPEEIRRFLFGGKIFTLEIDPEKTKLARENFKRAGVNDLITIIAGDAHERVKQHQESIDVVFLDAEKKGYIDYLKKLLPLVRPGGLILGCRGCQILRQSSKTKPQTPCGYGY